MSDRNFTNMLLREIAGHRLALVNLYETKDHLLYVDAPALRAKYMEVFGEKEGDVLEQELELKLLRRKLELIRIAINRREPVDLADIEAKLSEERQRYIADVERDDKTLQEVPELSPEETQELQQLYHRITKSFHPGVNPNLSDVERAIYERAQEAYRRQDLHAMRLLCDMLFEPVDGVDLEVSEDTEEDHRSEQIQIARELSTDYTLARLLFPGFRPSEEQMALLEQTERYGQMQKTLEAELSELRSSFPFNAQATLNDSVKTNDYLTDLDRRARNCREEAEQVTREIETLLKEHPHA